MLLIVRFLSISLKGLKKLLESFFFCEIGWDLTVNTTPFIIGNCQNYLLSLQNLGWSIFLQVVGFAFCIVEI